MIELKSVSKFYQMGDENLAALDDVSLTIKDGEFVAIVGPSGSGKTTLANAIGGLDSPSSGDIIIDGKEITILKDKLLSDYRNKKVGFIFQTFNLQSDYTALENVILPLMLNKISPAERKAKAIECLKSVGLENRMSYRPNQLSGGQRQRVSIARALANDPQIVIADEPTGNLDTKTSSEIISLLRKLNEDKKITLIVITHDEDIAKQADRIIYMKDGKVRKS